MKNIFVVLLVLCSSQLLAQTGKNMVPRELSDRDKEMLMSIPDLPVPDSYKNKSLPAVIDNSQLPYFRPMFTQAGMSCGQASSTGILFTYEMNRARNLPANTNTNLYPTHFVYDWAAGDWGSNGVSYYHTLDVLNKVGTPNQAEYGGTIDAGGNLRWMTGYDLYYSAMHNRVDSYYAIRNVNTAAGIEVLKNWMNDHLDGSEFGGCAIFYSTVPSPDASLPAGTEEAGKYVITTLYGGTSHSMALLGYNDNIRYDYNGDGQYTNNIDLNNDSQIDMRDWEIGGLKMCNTYSGGPNWANGGFCYLTYKAIADGAFWSNTVHVMKVKPDYEPTLTVRAKITHTNRKRIKVIVGMSTNLSATNPEYYLDFPILDFQGGDRFMTGGTAEADKTIEFGLDITPFLNILDPGQNAKFFLRVTENDAEAWGVGQVNEFTVIDYSSGSPNITTSSQTNVDINHNSTTTLSLTKTVNHQPPQIQDTQLPPGAIMSSYSHTMSASEGTPPYIWSFDTEYNISSSTTTFPTASTTQSLSGFTQVSLGFSFPFAGSNYSNVYVSPNGLMVFQSGFGTSLPYNVDDDIVFLHAKCIAPFFTAGVSSTCKKQTGSGWVLLSFDNTVLDYAVKLYQNGDIEFFYQNGAMTAQQIFSIGVSMGDGVNVQRLFFPDQTNIPNGFSYHLEAKLAPTEFQMSPEGVLTGFPTVEYISTDFHIKVRDNNNLIQRKTLQFVTDGLIMQFIPHTANNDIPEYAETVNIEIEAENPMVTAATGISVNMTCSDPYIAITDATASLPNLNPGASTNQMNALQFTIAANTPDQHTASFQFAVVSDQDTWNYFQNFIINSPKIQPGSITVNDGNDNMLGVGETANVQLMVHNNGHAAAGNINISLSTEDPYLSLNSNPATINNLQAGISQAALFNVSVTESVPELHVAEITMNITADNGYTSTETFTLTIHTPVISAGSLAVDDGDDHILSAGETSNIRIPLHNTGFVDATNLTVSISTTDEYVTINSNDFEINAITAGSTQNSIFNVTVSPDAPLAHYVLFELQVTGDHGLSTTLYASTVIGLLIENFESGDLNAFEWVSSGNTPWYPVTDVVYEGTYSLRSGTIGDNQSSVLSLTTTVVAPGPLTFAYKVSSENYYDFLEFMVDGLVIASWSGAVPWTVYTYSATAGDHTFAWRYRKDVTIAGGSDCAWIDSIVFPAINGNPPQLELSQYEVEKWMYTDETDTDTLVISNAGGGILNYSITWNFAETKSTKNITGSTLTSNLESFASGETYDITFSVFNASTDQEWLKTINISFPEGFVVNSYTDFTGGSGGALTSTSATGNGVSLNWSTTNQWGTIYGNETATCQVNVTIDPTFATSLAELNYEIYGDVYGSEPHTLTGSIIMTNMSSFWLSVSPIEGSLPFFTSNDLLLNYNSEGLENGFYHANINIEHSNGTTVVPVTLQIVNVSVGENEQSKTRVYPNPFNNEVIIAYNQGSSTVTRIDLTDIQGRSLLSLKGDDLNNSGGLFTIQTSDLNLPDGMYFVRIYSDNEIQTFKLTRQQ